MVRSILQEYLDNQFINLDNDENLGKLNQAIDELKQTLAKDKRKIVSACLAALDPDIPEHGEGHPTGSYYPRLHRRLARALAKR